MQALTNLPVHHIGFAVKSIEESACAFEALGARLAHRATDLERNLDFCFATLGGGMIELVCPHNPELPSAVSGMVKKSGCTLYHICYKTENLTQVLSRLQTAGFKRISKIIPTAVHGYKSIGTFLYNSKAGVIELIQEDRANGQP